MINDEVTERLAHVLDRIRETHFKTSRRQEDVHHDVANEIGRLRGTDFLPHLTRAVVNEPTRLRWVPILFAELGSVPNDVNWLETAYWSAKDVVDRSLLLIWLGHFKMRRFAPLLNRIMMDDPDLRDEAIRVCGQLAVANLPIIMDLSKMEPNPHKWYIASALKDYAVEEGRDFLVLSFNNPSDAHADAVKAVAAWGLAKMGDRSAYAWIVRSLQAANPRSPDFFDVAAGPAEALASLEGLEIDDPYVRNVEMLIRAREIVLLEDGLDDG